MANPQQLQQQLNQINEQFDLLEDKLDNIGTLLTDKLKNKISDLKDEARDFVDKFSKGEDVTKAISTKLLSVQKDLNKLSLKRNDLENDLIRAQANNNRQAEVSIRTALNSNKLASSLIEELQSQLIILQKTAEEEKKRTKEKKNQNSFLAKANILASVFEKIGLGTLFTFKGLVDAVFKVDNEITQMGKSLGISHNMAEDLRNSMAAYSLASKDGFINTHRLTAAQAGLTEQLGIAVDFGNQERETFARLTEITGLAADEAGRLAKFSAVTGVSTKDYVSDLRVAANEAMRANRIHISDKELLSSIAKLSAGILVKFQNNPKALAEAVIQAKKLGLSLEQIDKIGESMLDWEFSIQNELEAELITGRKLNFERARAAALTGDQAELMQEVASQAGSLAEYQNMNVIAQQSLAKAFGMSRDEMSEMLMKQESIAKYGDAAAKLNKEQLEDMQRRNMSAKEYLDMAENQRSTQERFNDLVTKLQDTFANIAAGPLGSIMSMFASIAENVGVMYTLIAAAALIIGANMAASLGKTITQLRVIVGLRTAEAAAAVTTSQAMTLGLSAIGIIGGIALVMGALSSAKSQSVKDGIAPSNRGPFTIMDNYGATAITAAGDGLAVSPNINRTNNSGMAGVMNAIGNLASAINRPQPTPQFALNVDGQRLGMVTGRQQITGTEQVKNSYRLA